MRRDSFFARIRPQKDSTFLPVDGSRTHENISEQTIVGDRYLGQVMTKRGVHRMFPIRPRGCWAIILFLLLSTLGRPNGLFAETRHIRFDHISIDQGLSQSSVHAILQDDRGFMWFATQDGLNKYDGYDFTIYRHETGNAASLPGNHVISLFKDSSGVLWIGANTGGLNRYHPETDSFSHYIHDPENPQSISDNRVTSICEDRSGYLWIGTEKGVNRLDRKTGTFHRFTQDSDDPKSLSHDNVTAVYEDTRGVLWVGTKNGLNRYDPSTGGFVRYLHDPENPGSIGRSLVWHIFDDGESLWISTWGGGLNRFDRSEQRFTRFRHDPTDPATITSDYVSSAFRDREGVFWIATKEGLNRFDPVSETFQGYRHDSRDERSLSHDYLTCVFQDRSGVIWVGTLAGGINKFSKYALKNSIEHYTETEHDPNGLNNRNIWSIVEDKAGIVWVGTDKGLSRFDRSTKTFTPCLTWLTGVRSIVGAADGVLWLGTISDGLVRYDPMTKSYRQFKRDPDDPSGLSDNSAMTLFIDSSGLLWVGTWDGGLNAHKGGGVFRHYKHDARDPQSLSNNIVRCVYEDRQGVLWVGTNDGLNRFHRDTGRFDAYRRLPGEPEGLSNNTVRCIHQGRTGDIWIGTNGGLNRFNKKTGKFVSYRESDGLSNDTIYGILEDDAGHLWLTTNRGLSVFDPKSQRFRIYNHRDGLQSDEFNAGAYHKNGKGELFVGGINGFNIFDPDAAGGKREYVPGVILTKFQKFHTDVNLKPPIYDAEEIVLTGEENIFSFQFAALDYTAPQKSRYRYMLEPFDGEWVDAGNRRLATYTNLDPGEYTFRVKACNAFGVWSPETAISVVIQPRWWQTWMFKTLMAVIFGIFVYAALTVYRARERFDSLAFVGGYIAHEINSPLASLRMNSDLLRKLRPEQDIRIRRIAGNIQNDIVQIQEGINAFRDLEPIFRRRGKGLAYDSVDIVPLIDDHLARIRKETDRHRIRITVDCDPCLKMEIDPMDFKVILKNLLSNAVRAVNLKQGDNYEKKIRISAAYSGDGRFIVLEVRDNGVGMNRKSLMACRRPYFSTRDQVKNLEASGSTPHFEPATTIRGVGLAIVQNKIDKYGMKIEIESSLSEGSAFRILMPVKPRAKPA